MERKGKHLENPLKRKRGRDLTRFFEVIGSGSSSNPSTRKSVNISAHSIHHDQVNSMEVEHENVVPTEQVEEHTTNSVEAIVEENVEAHGVEEVKDVSDHYGIRTLIGWNIVAGGLVHQMETFSFVFILKMMLKIFRMTNDLSLLLQKKDQNVVQAMSLVTDVRTRLINWRNDGWEPLLEDVKAFCTKNDIPIPSMDDIFTKWGKSRKHGRNNVTADHFLCVDSFYGVIDSITTKFDRRFNELSSELLQNFSCFDPRDSFSRFNRISLLDSQRFTMMISLIMNVNI